MPEEVITQSSVTFADPTVQRCPFDAYAQLRETGPVYKDPKTGYYVVLGYDLLREVLMDTDRFSSNVGIIQVRPGELGRKMQAIQKEFGVPAVPVLLTTDPPEHTFYRSLVGQAFSPNRVKKLEEFLTKTVSEHIDSVTVRSPIEFVSEICVMIPVFVLLELLGVDRSYAQQIKTWSDTAAATGDPTLPEERILELTRIACDYQRFIAEQTDRYRSEPNDSLLSAITNADVNGRQLTRNELVALSRQIMTAGHETTTNTMASGMLWLIERPELQDQLRADPSLMTTFIEELLRLESPLQAQFRKTMDDVVLGGVPIPKGAVLDVRFGAGNCDPEQFPNPRELDLKRGNLRTHLAFGAGPHFCIGNQLARAELRIAFTHLLSRLKNFRFADVEEPVKRVQHYFIHGVKELHLAYDLIDQ
ncbi:cytochrome P450 [Sphingobium sp. V4]|uniref:cytochrome P450 n=1 Tax=Sphingobium sp. V4 TaxID=3038927 RepID=UPI0025582AC6|nr:cytochrome P450 [Sphingobium sp. V4]WIW89531.1 cytochrome P450 [Sphingobium sp. V4]